MIKSNNIIILRHFQTGWKCFEKCAPGMYKEQYLYEVLFRTYHTEKHIKQLLHFIIYGYSLYVLRVFQQAFQWLVHFPKLCKHHWRLWIKRCTWAHGISLTNTCVIKLDLLNWAIEKKEMKFIIFGRWCSCNCYTVTYISHLLPCAHMCQFLQEHSVSQGNHRSTMIF